MSGRYRLESKLGSGGMSTVYLAIDETLGRKVAIKVMHREISDQQDQLERFRREARAVAQLSHPNLVAVIDAGEDGGHPYIVFEYVPGETLKKRIAESGRLEPDEATAYAIEIGRGLAAAHAARLVHRDVKPQNVLIDADGRAKVTDFGIARSIEEHGLTATGRVLGTTDYVSPEQAMGKEVDARTDVYSLGIVLYEMLTGEVPFQAETQVGVAMKHVNELMPDVQLRRPETSAVLANAVDRSTAKQPQDRYADMNDFLADLEGALEVEVSRAGGGTGEATTVLRTVPQKRRWLPNRRKVSWGAVIVLAIAAGVAIAIAAFSGGDHDPEKQGTAPVPTAATIEITNVEDYDPQGTPVPEEHPDDIPNIIDGDDGTSWSTEDYDAGLAGAPKTGVGFVLGTDGAAEATNLTMQTNGGSWSFDVYATNEKAPPEEPPIDTAGAETGSWGDPIAVDNAANKSTDVALDPPTAARWYLVWITDLNGVRSAEVFGAQLESSQD